MKKDSINEIKEKITPILKDYGVEKAALFGSAARGRMRKDSDIDILVDIKKDISLLDLIKMKFSIEDKINRKVDIVEYDSIKPSIKDYILKEQIVIL